MQLIAGLVSGLIFGFGLIIAGMVNPLKVQNFLDLAGHWDPSLAFVMAGAIAVALPGFRWLSGRSEPTLGGQFYWPTRQQIDWPLLSGAVLFGVGWGLSGLCPGPVVTVMSAIVLPGGSYAIVPFFIAMIAGMMIARVVQHWLSVTGRVSSQSTG